MPRSLDSAGVITENPSSDRFPTTRSQSSHAVDWLFYMRKPIWFGNSCHLAEALPFFPFERVFPRRKNPFVKSALREEMKKFSPKNRENIH